MIIRVNDAAPAEFDLRKTRRKRLMLILFSVLGFLILLPLVWFGYLTVGYYLRLKSGDIVDPNARRMQASLSSYVANAKVTPADIERLTPAGLAPELGNRSARVTVIEFADYQCPFCKEQAPIVRRVIAAMGNQVHFLIRDFPVSEIHPDARNAALAANCILAQGQDPYWRFHDLVYMDQEHMSPDDLRKLATFVNVDMAQYDACMEARTYDRKIDKDVDDGRRAGVQGTPTFFVNGVRFQGLMDEKTFTLVLNQFLEAQPK